MMCFVIFRTFNMSSLSRFGLLLSRSIHTSRALRITATGQRCAYWNKDWMPGPYPRTVAERAAAAKKYGLRPEDYEPYPDEDGYGDYPKLPAIGDDSKDYYNNYDMPIYKRNFGEPMHKDFDLYTEDKFNPTMALPMSLEKMAGIFLLFMATLVTIYRLSDNFMVYQPCMPKQMVKQGNTHYTFETVE